MDLCDQHITLLHFTTTIHFKQLTTLSASTVLLFENRLDFLLPETAPPSCPITSQNTSGEFGPFGQKFSITQSGVKL